MGGVLSSFSKGSLALFFAEGGRWEGSSGQRRVAAKPNASARTWIKKKNQREKTARWFPVHQELTDKSSWFCPVFFRFLCFSPVFSPVRSAKDCKNQSSLSLGYWLICFRVRTSPSPSQAGDKAGFTSRGLSFCFSSDEAVFGIMIQQYSGVIQGVPMFS